MSERRRCATISAGPSGLITVERWIPVLTDGATYSRSFGPEAEWRLESKTLAALAVPDLFLATLLTPLNPGSLRHLFRIASRCLLNVPAFVFSNLGKRAARENRSRSDLSHILFSGVVVSVLYQQPLTISRPDQAPTTLSASSRSRKTLTRLCESRR